jgi:FkbM family methyltransferase
MKRPLLSRILPARYKQSLYCRRYHTRHAAWLFQKNVERNNFQDKISLVPKAAGDRAGTIQFDAGPPDQTGWGGITDGSSSKALDVPMVRLDEQLGNINIEVLKIDVEGADTLVCSGAKGC